MMSKLSKEKDKDLVEIKHLRRIRFDELYHRDSEMFDNMVENSVQAFVIGETKYGCFVAAKVENVIADLLEDSKPVYEFQFFEFRDILDNGVQKITPIEIYEFVHFLELMRDSEYVEGLLFHIDEIKEEHRK